MDETFLAVQRALAGEYSLEREIGRGGMGIVYLAREVQLDRLVAIKVLPASLAAVTEIRERFAREARTAAALSHPNIVPIHRVGDAEGLPYFVMTYVHGETLGERLRSRGPLSPTALTRVMHDVALALGYAHGRGVVHRDVKPDNILLEEASGRALVTDFGIAHMKRAGDSAEGEIVGTVQFMSPEQARGDHLDGRSDVYSLGVVAFLAASGKLPHDSPSVAATLARIATVQAAKVSSAATGMPGGIARVIDRCLALDVADRFRTAEEVASALDAAAVPARPMLPEVIREWTSQPAPLLNVYGFWSTGWFIAALSEYVEWVNRGAYVMQDHGPTNTVVGLTIASIPLLPIAIFQLRKTHRALAAGYSLNDLRTALRAWVDSRKTQLESTKESGWVHALRGFTWGTAVFVPTAMIGSEFVFGPSFMMNRSLVNIVVMTLFAGVGSLTMLSALGAPIISPKVERPLAGRLRSWLWNSRVGAWLADRLTPSQRGVPETQFRATELALKVAVEDLYAALPQPYRQLIGDLPPIASRLSEHVTQLRREVERLEVIRSQARNAEEATIDGLLGSSRAQLGQAVGALERMRLELLRLHGGAEDVRPLTTSLDLARAMVEDIVRLREADASLSPDRRALPIDLRTPSPA